MSAPWMAEARGDDRPIIVRVGDDGTAPPAGAVHRMGAMPFTAGYAFNAITYSPDGKRLLSTHPGGAAIVWDAATGKRVITLAEEGSYARSAAFLKNDQMVVAWGSRKVATYDIATGREGLLWDAPTGLEIIASSRDGRRVVTAMGEVRLWDPQRGKVVATYDRPPKYSFGGPTTQFDFVDDGRLLLIGTHRGGAALVRGDNLKPVPCRLFPAQVQSGAVAISPDGKVVALETRGGAPLATYDVATGAARPALRWNGGPPAGPDFLSFSPDGRILAAVSKSIEIRLYDLRADKELPALRSKQRQVNGLTWSPDGQVLIAYGARQMPEFWQMADPAAPVPLFGSDAVGALIFTIGVSPDGHEIAAGDNSGQLTRWDIERGAILARRPGAAGTNAREEALYLLKYRPDGEAIEAVTFSGRFERLDERTFQPSSVIKTSNPDKVTAAFSPDFRMVAQGTRDRGVRVWDRSTGRQLYTFPANLTKEWVGGMAFSRDGKRLAVAQGTNVRVFEFGKGDPVAQLDAPGAAPLGHIAFSPDGAALACAEQRGVWLWDLRARQLRWNHRSTGWPLSLSFSPDGLMLAAPAETDVLLLDVPTGDVVAQLPGHAETVYPVAFLPDGLRVVSGSQDGSVIVWELRRVLALPPAPPPSRDARSAEQLWAALGSDDDDVASVYRAASALLERPADVLRRAREVLRRAGTSDHWSQLIELLSADDVKVRNKAHRELEAGGQAAAAAVREALRDPPTGEAGERLRSLAKLFGVRRPDAELPVQPEQRGAQPMKSDPAMRTRLRAVQLLGWLRAASPTSAVAAGVILEDAALGPRTDPAAAAARALVTSAAPATAPSTTEPIPQSQPASQPSNLDSPRSVP